LDDAFSLIAFRQNWVQQFQNPKVVARQSRGTGVSPVGEERSLHSTGAGATMNL
jgi:hypothetical protein